jgi:16S rRNA (cytosine1402-N4)-methyltransferase
MREDNLNELTHVSVLYDEILRAVAARPGGLYIDATINGGGHAQGILEASAPDGKLLGIDADAEAISAASARLQRFGSRVTLVNSNFVNIKDIAHTNGFVPVNGIIMDLGLSSRQLAQADRGFSFSSPGPLDMRFDTSQGETAADLVNELSESELAAIIRDYGEEPRARAVARVIVAARTNAPITTTDELATIVARVAQRSASGIHPATRTFQALRIAVNHELDHLTIALRDALELLAPGGRLAIIAFHSLEDRIVKQFFAEESRGCICPPKIPVCVCQHRPKLINLTKKPIMPSDEELKRNPRSRSARLRVAQALD